MPNEQELAIILRFRDLATSQLNQAVGNAARHLNELGQKMQAFGRQMRQVGSNLTFLGAAITGPLLLAFRQAIPHSQAVSEQAERLRNVFLNFQISIANALVPVIERLTNLLGGLLNAWNSLSPATQQMIVQGAFLAGAFLLLSGTITIIISKLAIITGFVVRLIGSFLGFVVANAPLVILLTIIIGIIAAMFKWKIVADIVLNSIEAIIRFFLTGFLTVKIAILEVANLFLNFIENVLKAASKLPGKLGAPFRQGLEEVQKWRQKIQDIQSKDMEGLIKQTEKLRDIFAGKQGKLAAGFENIKEKIGGVIEKVKDLGKIKVDIPKVDLPKLEQTKVGFEAFWEALGIKIRTTTKVMEAFITSLQSKFSSLFERIITEGGKAKEIFAEFGKAILTTIVQMIAKFLAFIATVTLIAGILSAFGVPPGATFKAAFKFLGAFAKGGIVPNVEAAQIPTFQHGGEVLAGVTPGEFIVNPEATRHNRALLERINRGESIRSDKAITINNAPVLVIQAWDVNSVLRHREEIEAIISSAIVRNNHLRYIILNYAR